MKSSLTTLYDTLHTYVAFKRNDSAVGMNDILFNKQKQTQGY